MMRKSVRSIEMIAGMIVFAFVFVFAVAKIQGTYDGDSLVPGAPHDLAAAVAHTGRLAVVGGAAAVLLDIGVLIWLRLHRKPDPHVDFTATDGSHVQLRLSMSPGEINENVLRIRSQLEMFEKAAAQPASRGH